MGMFDDLTCEYPLPRPEMQGNFFQTKSLECAMNEYRISRDGQLIRVERVVEPVPEGEHDYYFTLPDGGKIGFPLLRRTGEVTEVIVHYHGDIEFYDFIDEPHRRLVHFVARFTNGHLEWIREVSGDE